MDGMVQQIMKQNVLLIMMSMKMRILVQLHKPQKIIKFNALLIVRILVKVMNDFNDAIEKMKSSFDSDKEYFLPSIK